MLRVNDIVVGDLSYETSHSLIYRGTTVDKSMPVFLKVSAQQSVLPSEQLGIKREFDLLRLFDSDKIIKAIDLLHSTKGYVLILEDFGGVDLHSHIIKYSPTWIEMVYVARDVAQALAEIHDKNVIHKDISPSNILYNQQTRQVKVIDFGISSRLERESQDICVKGVLEGNLPYISPEQTGRTSRDLDYRTDFYSFGATLYELFTGKPPFETDDTMGYIHSHLARTPYRIDSINPRIPPVIADIVEKLLQKNMEDRYQSSTALIKDLETCIRFLDQGSEVGRFSIAEGDVCEKFILPQRLVGREREVQDLLTTFRRAADGSREMLLIEGVSGIGKSSLIDETRTAIALSNAIFLKGKFDQYTQDVPYSAIAQAIDKDLVDYTLKQKEASFRNLRASLNSKLSSHASLISNLAPRMEKILGNQDTLDNIDPLQAQSKFHYAMATLFQATANRKHPLVLFLDDVQWADHASLELIKALLTNEDQGHFLVICSYRSNEVTDAHPFSEMVQNLKEISSIQKLKLTPLDSEAISNYVSEALHLDIEEIRPLGQEIHARTEGNPYFAGEYLRSLFYEGVIYFDRKKGQWQYSINQVLSHIAPTSMLGFMVGKIQELSNQTMEVLKVAACIGSRFSLTQLNKLSSFSSRLVFESINEATDNGLISPLDEGYRLLYSATESDYEIDQEIDFKFHHDKIQQACYQVLSDTELAKIHLNIARILSKEGHTHKSIVIDLVRHYNLGKNLITDSKELDKLFGYNLDACEISLNSGATKTAFKYGQIATGLARQEILQENYELHKRFLRLMTMSAFFSGRKEEGGELGLQFANLCKTNLEKAQAMLLIGGAYETFTDWEQSVKHFRIGYRYIGKKLPKIANPLAILYYYFKIRSLKITKEYIESLPQATESDEIEITLLERMTENLHQLSHPVMFVYTIQKTLLSLYFKGRSRYTHVAMLPILQYCTLCLFEGPSKRTSDLLKVSKQIVNASEDDIAKSRALFILALFHFQGLKGSGKKVIMESISLARKTREYMSLVSSLAIYGTSGLHSFVDNQIEALKKYQAEIEQLNSLSFYNDNKIYIETLHMLKEDNKPLILSEKALELYNQIETRGSRGSCEINQAKVLFIEGHYFQAYEWIKKAERKINAIKFFIWETYLIVLGFLIRASIYSKVSTLEKVKIRLLMTMAYKFIKNRWRVNPTNFGFFKAILDAEWSKIRGEPFEKSLNLYQTALSKGNDFFPEWGFIGGLQAFRYVEHFGVDSLSYHYLEQALDRCRKWGAEGTASRLEGDYNHLIMTYRRSSKKVMATSHPSFTLQPTRSSTVRPKTSTITAASGFDIEMALQLYRSLSTEVHLKDLLTKLLEVLIENTGATKVILLMKEEETGHFYVEARKLFFDQPALVKKIPIERCKDLPIEIMKKVIRMDEALVIDDARNHRVTKESEWINNHKIKSLLITPLSHRNSTIGFIYLENTNLAASFTSDRLEIVNFLASQAAVSILNSKLYETLEEKIRERTQEVTSILSNIEQGIFLIEDQATIHEHYSKNLEEIFQTKRIAGLAFSDLIFTDCDLSSDIKDYIYSTIITSLGEDVIFYHLNSHPLPKAMKIFRGQTTKHLTLEWNPVLDSSDTVTRILVSIKDVTRIKSLEKESKADKEELEIIRQVLNIENQKFRHFAESSKDHISTMISLCSEGSIDQKDLVRQIFLHMHTMKGQAKFLNLSLLTTTIHTAEDSLSNMRDGTIPKDVRQIRMLVEDIQTCYLRYEHLAYAKLGKERVDSSHQLRPQIEPLIGILEDTWGHQKSDQDNILTVIRALKGLHSPSGYEVFSDIFGHSIPIAKELDKEIPRIDINMPPVYFSNKTVSMLHNVFSHFIRNALDHGIETESVRKAAGKSPQGCLSLSGKIVPDGSLHLTFRDDGKGLDLEKINETAIRKELISPHQQLSAAEISHFILRDGFSTNTIVSEVSGRGVGVGSAQSLLEEHGAKMYLTLDQGASPRSTPFSITIVLPVSCFSEQSHPAAG